MEPNSPPGAKYFADLNYSLANEDTLMEVSMVKDGVSHILSVAGSGARVVPLLSKRPKIVTCVDLSKAQLYLTELRIEALRTLTLREYRALLGYPLGGAADVASGPERKSLFERLELSAPARAFFASQFGTDFASMLYAGRWERTFDKLSRINRAVTGAAGAGIFECRTMDEQLAYYERDFPHRRFGLVVQLLGNANVFNALLYRGAFPKKNIPGSFVAFYKGVFDHLFRTGLARENYFLQLCFFGKIAYEEGVATEASTELFESAKEAARAATVHYVGSDILNAAKTAPSPIDYLSISDVPSYWAGELERGYLAQLRPVMSEGGRVVTRAYLHVPEGLDTAGYTDISPSFSEAIRRERVGVYKVFVHEKTS